MRLRKTTGVSLLEVLIAIAIIAALAIYAYPKYTRYVTKTRRLDGQVALLELATELNEYHAQHHSYKGATLMNLDIQEISPEGYYTLTINGATDKTYLIEASPVKSQAKNDTECGSYTYNQAGEKTITGTGTVAECW